MHTVLKTYLPERAVDQCISLIKEHQVHLKIVNERLTRHGDYRMMPSGMHMITINSSLNKYRFLITLIHEIAHLYAFEQYGKKIKPHGIEWKQTFKYLMLPFLRTEVFPSKLLSVVANHFKNPKASSDTDAVLAISLRSFDDKKGKVFVYELPMGTVFKMNNGKLFKKGKKRVKRYECMEEGTDKMYLFQPNAEVEFIK